VAAFWSSSYILAVGQSTVLWRICGMVVKISVRRLILNGVWVQETCRDDGCAYVYASASESCKDSLGCPG
jgi:hypothetical protein